ncbi:MAG TPA: T9SS type A sorting domain-containing protein, partial [Ignavibacteriaceae bacterium]|nr:T9SS type A sorting domain-containing protein [Ignavibacteriaceae bacterium]
VLITWETASETNNAGFNVERSSDNVKFESITFIKGKGTTTAKSHYSYSDVSVLSAKCFYRLKQVDYDGSFNYSKSIEVNVELPEVFALEQNYPNPFNPTTAIRFSLPSTAKVSIKLYNTLGQEIVTILDVELQAGNHEKIFNASNLSSGVYFYRLEATGADGSNFVSMKRMILIK